MKILFRVTIIIVILIVSFLWMMIMASSHNVKIEMKIIPLIVLAVLLSILFYNRIFKSNQK